eukprot:CAMPEP_0197027418 /NCGR_PEP_ID=MMETSP1384-20130603/7323_1 /TAXON_ID=29189 /ORGANISM="Ammonia sp." /LENGTH=369 /DNA_ID=CAMNT_0042456253 /DNA_START=62 /DNA_END=1171 /DNA_ORIENTATION=-
MAMKNQNPDEEELYTFVVEWFDSVADLTRKYHLRYWPSDNSLSMYDVAKNRLFLKRIVNQDISFPNDLYVGKTIVVYSRQLKIIDYADAFTRNKFESISNCYHILFIGFKSFTAFLAQIYKHDTASFHYKSIHSIYANQRIQHHLKLKKENEILITCEFVGSKDIALAFNECSNNAECEFTAKMCDETADQSLLHEIKQSASSADLSEESVSSVCLIKPHALSFASAIIDDVLNEGFFISAIATKKLTLSEAKRFYQVYEGVVKEYSYMIEQILSGSVIALQVQCNSMDVHNGNENEKNVANVQVDEINSNAAFQEFREFVGPKDPEIAKYIRPHTLRAKYGVDVVQNAIHCTDLQEDGGLETKFFFSA